MSAEQVARWLDVSTTTVYRLVRRGELRASRVGRKIRIRREDVETFIKESGENDG